MSKSLPSEISSVQQRAYVTYHFPDCRTLPAPSVTLLESRSVISAAGTTGLRTWEASLHLASFLMSSAGTEYIRRNRVLEIGAGTGLISILCTKHLSARHVLATDGSQDVVDALPDNLFVNGLQSNPDIECQMLRWGRYLEQDENGKEKAFDILLGADVVSTVV
jgi:protein-lysine N-methyltransferase EEF2KMT